jgi:hypothetical protein
MPAAAVAVPAAISIGGSAFNYVTRKNAINNATRTQTDAANAYIKMIQDAVEGAATGATDAAGKAATEMNDASRRGQDILTNVYGETKENIAPYLEAGTGAIKTLADLMAEGGELRQKFDPNSVKVENDPGYAFRLQQGNQALARSAAAKGNSLGGGAAKALARYSQDYASNEYSNAYTRARDAFETGQNNLFNRLSGLANYGQNANQQLLGAGQQYGSQMLESLMEAARFGGLLNTQAAQYAGTMRSQGAQLGGNAMLDAANTRASGYIAKGNAAGDLIGQGTAAAQDIWGQLYDKEGKKV